MLSQVSWLEVPDFSFETHEQFWKSRKAISKFVDDVLQLQKGIEFIAQKKLWVDSKKWEQIFSIIESSRVKNNFSDQEIDINWGFIAKLFLIFWDKQLVALLILLIESWILSISDNRVNQILVELENKIHGTLDTDGINLWEVYNRIIENNWRWRYKWVVTDNYFDRKDILLGKHGGRQLRMRERILDTQQITETLTGKRKFWKLWKEREYALSHFFEKLGWEIDIEKIEKFMKILLEEEMDIHDMNALEDIFRILWFYMVRSKIKLRASMEIRDTKMELEYYPWILATKTKSWFMRPFIEQEAPSMESAEEVRRLVWLYGEKIVLTTDGSEWAFKFDGAQESYLRFWNGGTKDSRVHLERDRIKREALRKMYNWYFDTFEV